MSLPSLSLRRPVLAIVLNIILVLFGGIGFYFLGVREYPSIDPPIITVRTNYSGATAEIIEDQITEPLEKSINGIAGIKSISSSSNQGNSQISVEFDLSVNLDDAANDVRDKVAQTLRQLPQDIDAPPVVSKADANSDAIVAMLITSESKNQLEITDYAVNVILERMQTIPGVSSVQIWGEKRYAMRLWMNPEKMASLNITPSDVNKALQRENVELPGGKLTGSVSELTVRTLGRLSTEAEFNDLIIRNDPVRPVRFSDIGTAMLGPENEETLLRESGIPMIGLALVPQPGANYIDIADEFYRRFDQIKKEIPKEYQVTIGYDQTTFIRNSILEVEETLGIAFLLVVLIIYLFFRDWLIAVRPLIDIPVSLIATFFLMYLFGFTINVLTLLGIVLATGLVVDDGIVVTENIYKKIEQGLRPKDAARIGSEEIYFAVISTSLTLAVVFLPVIFLQGFVGALFREFGIVVAGAVLISAFVSLTLTPVLNVYLSRKNHKRSRFYEWSEPFFDGMTEGYKRSLKTFMRKRWLALPVLLLCAGAMYYFFITIKQELAPLEDRNAFRLSLTMPEGTSFDAMDDYTLEVVDFILDSIPEKQGIISVTAPGFIGSGSPNTAFVRILLKDASERSRSQMQLADMVSKNLSRFPEGRAFAIQEQTIATSRRFGGLPVQFVIQHPDFDKLKEKLPEFLAEAQKDPTFQIIDADLKFNKPELQVTVDRDKASALGVSIDDISQALQLAYSGRRISYFTMNGKQYQVMGQFDRTNRNEPSDLKKIYVRNAAGVSIALDNLVTISEQSNPPQLYHYDRYKSATVSAGLAQGKTIGDGITAMNRIADKVLDESFSTALSGSSRDFAESSSNTLFAFVVALLLVYLLLAAQFESWKDPLIIMITVPLAITGGLLSLGIFGMTLNIFSQIGFIMLIGLVTKNGILIVEFANHKKTEGLNRTEAVVEASALRLRPILMTSIATILGALPIALSLGAASAGRKPLGVVIVGGLIFSLILTLYIIPAMYALLSSNKVRYEETA
jgi:multidrug efflux pump